MPQSLDIKVGMPQVGNTKSSSFLVTTKGVAFQQENASTHSGNRHIITYSSPMKGESWIAHLKVFIGPLRLCFLAMSHLYVFFSLMVLTGGT